MRFFVPSANTPSEAENIWQGTRQFLGASGFVSAEKRIWKVAYRRAGEAMVLKVGDTHAESGEEVLVILKSADDSHYFICTASRGVIGGKPCTLANVLGQTLAVEFH